MNPLDDILGGPPAAPAPEQQPTPEAAPPPKQEAAKDPLSDLIPTSGAAPQPKAEPQQEHIGTWAEVPSAAAKHLVPSAISAGEAIAQPFLHPIQTYENIRDLGHGVLQKAGIMSGDEDTSKVDAVMKMVADRYGSMDKLRDTIANDPAGFVLDASTVLTGGGGLAARAPGLIGKAGEAARAVGELPFKAVGAAGRKLAPGLTDAEKLAEAGITMTPGQIGGGLWKSTEDLATSIPGLRDFIQGGRGRSIEDFNKAVGNAALKPIGQSLEKGTEAGHAAVSEVESKLGAAYDAIAPNLKWIPDQQWKKDIKNIYQTDYTQLPPAGQKEFDRIMNKQLPRFVSPTTGAAPFKPLESTLSTLATTYSGANNASDRLLGGVLRKVLIAARDNAERTNPQLSAQLKDINTGWAMYTRMRNAAARGTEGVFTPSQLVAAVKSGDKSVGKGAFARGDALMQDFAQLAQRVLPSKIPTSGTAERSALMAGLAGGYFFQPHIAAGITGGLLPYTRPGMAAINKAVFSKKPWSYLPRGSTFQAGRLDETEQEAYDRARRLFPQ